jgi:3,2-trans-enoyl-CoA isomerase
MWHKARFSLRRISARQGFTSLAHLRATGAVPTILTRSKASAAEPSSTVVVQIGDHGMASVYLSSPPVNALTKRLLQELMDVISELEENPKVRGFILGSAVPKIFSAGIHLPEMLVDHDGSTEGVATFWTLLQETWLKLYTTPLATVAAIPGACPAGGCLLALSCDARVMVENKGTIGLNEAAFGLIPPPWLSGMLIGVAGQRKAEDMIMRGVLLPPAQALLAGIVDVTVPLSSLSDEATARLAALLAVPGDARVRAKAQLRRGAAEALRTSQAEDLDEMVTMLTRAEVQERIQSYLESLSSKRAGSSP